MKKTGFWESFILIAIVLVIAQTVVEELAPLLGWPANVRYLLVFSALFFDVLFSIEYLVRQIRAALKKEGLRYFVHRRGWIDLLASLPLLLLNSGPSVLLLLTDAEGLGLSIGVMNLLKVVKAVRVTRVLRFIRTIKIFGNIHNADSQMAQRHVSRLATLSVLLIIAAAMVFSFAVDSQGAAAERRSGEYRALLAYGMQHFQDDEAALSRLLSTRGDFLQIRYASGASFSTLPDNEILQQYTTDDFWELEAGGHLLTFSVLDLVQRDASVNLLLIIIIMVLVLALVLAYTKHFAQTVSDVVHIMMRGMTEPSYNLAVKIHPEYAEDEVFKLAEVYNDQWLALKDQHKLLGDAKNVNLSMEDFLGIGMENTAAPSALPPAMQPYSSESAPSSTASKPEQSPMPPPLPSGTVSALPASEAPKTPSPANMDVHPRIQLDGDYTVTLD